jgi:hypothetical protein
MKCFKDKVAFLNVKNVMKFVTEMAKKTEYDKDQNTMNLKIEKHNHKDEDSMSKEVPQHQPLIQTMVKRASGMLTAGKPLITSPNV